MKWRQPLGWLRRLRPAQRSDEDLRALAEEVAERFLAACDPTRPADPVPVEPILGEICAREQLSVDDLDRVVAHFGDVADEFTAWRLECAVPAGHA